MRSAQVRIARWLAAATYTQKWLVLGTVVGIIAGFGAVVFYEALRLATYVFLQVLAGYRVPLPASEGGRAASSYFARPWAIPLIACVGALAGAVLVFAVAPEAEGHGTDAAIAAVHHNPRGVRGEFNWSSQHLNYGGVNGQASWVDERVNGEVTDEVAGCALASKGSRARILA